jgi:single-strand DNA-binding protein
MAGVNKVILVGNLVRDPETRHTNSGDAIVNMTVATSETWKDKASGERKEKSEFTRVVIFNEHAGKIAQQYLRKGSKVYVEGQLATRKWTDQSGVEKHSTEVVLNRFRGELVLLDSKRDGAAADEGYSGGTGGGRQPDELDSEIPFSPEVRA